MAHKQEKGVKSLDQYWQESQAIFSNIYRTGVRKYMENLPTLGNAFKLDDHSVRCIDEGTPGGIHLAGSGILLSTSEKKIQLDNAIEELIGAGADGVYSHEHCGAAKLYANTIKHDPENHKNYAIEWAEQLAKLLGVPYKGHATELARPSEFHNARIAYYDGSGKFDPFKIKKIPDGFIISRYFLDQQYAKDELAIALSIALGHHGFGEKFTEENPFIIAPIQKFKTRRQGISMEDLVAEARDVASQYGSRVIVEGFTEPTNKGLSDRSRTPTEVGVVK